MHLNAHLLCTGLNAVLSGRSSDACDGECFDSPASYRKIEREEKRLLMESVNDTSSYLHFFDKALIK